MLEKLKAYKKYFLVGLTSVVIGSILIVIFKTVDNAPNLIMTIWEAIKNFFGVISPVINAFVAAYLLYYPVVYIENWINKGLDKLVPKRDREKRKASIRLISVTLIFLAVIGLIAMIINFIIPPLFDNIKILIRSIPKYEAQFNIWMKEIGKVLNTLNVDITNINIFNYVKGFLVDGGQLLINSLGGLISSFSSFVIDLVVSVILTFYFLKDKEKLFAMISKFGTIVCTPKVKDNIIDFVKTLDDVVGKYLLGTILDSFIVGVVSVLLMILIKHPFAILIGVAAGFTNVIPYVGPIVGSGLAFVLGAFTNFGLGITGAVLLLLYQQIDGNIVQPKIVGDKVGLLPVWILIAVLIGGSYFGGIGMIASVPTAALIGVYIDRLYKCKIGKK
ncbi:AI-2E family transporter [Zhenhengia yiwuensis]|uniref:AI-2E family transporter n=1 Tax=Zhenhengia yiwuensis TaxID=2763666 RepID=A0A926EF05_9FIRM|nr:AI-2E family transporter [Zhenhengia yiwuensis]MBC8579866.1 AI-2E family transporter [Zhenhengia yiwuensis]